MVYVLRMDVGWYTVLVYKCIRICEIVWCRSVSMICVGVGVLWVRVGVGASILCMGCVGVGMLPIDG